VSDVLLSIRDLCVYYFLTEGIVRAVDNVSLDLRRGDVLAVVGESGSGKSTLGYSILRLVPPPGKIVRGSILFEGIDLLKLPEEAMRRIRGAEISMVFQDPSVVLNPVMRVGEHIVEMLKYHRGMDEEEAWKLVEDVFESLGIPRDRARDYPHQLSGGMKQRVVIATAIVLRPKLIIADEPTTALDVITQDQILDIFRDLRDRYRVSIMLIIHDLSIVADLADRVVVMYAGKVVEEGSVEQIFYNPLHPYTRGLLMCTPRLISNDANLYSIPGEPPDLLNPPPGCRFHPRCGLCMDTCKKEEPPMIEVEPGHRVMCWLYAKR